jgi:hypothetical protein
VVAPSLCRVSVLFRTFTVVDLRSAKAWRHVCSEPSNPFREDARLFLYVGVLSDTDMGLVRARRLPVEPDHVHLVHGDYRRCQRGLVPGVGFATEYSPPPGPLYALLAPLATRVYLVYSP